MSHIQNRPAAAQQSARISPQEALRKQPTLEDVMTGLKELSSTGPSFDSNTQGAKIRKYKELRSALKNIPVGGNEQAQVNRASLRALGSIGPKAFKLIVHNLQARFDDFNTDGAIRRPTKDLARFSVAKSWDADSTPPALAAFSRAVGKLAPDSGARTPKIEASVAMASLMHDVSYYYGGGRDEKRTADSVFGDQIPYFAAKLDPSAGKAAKITAFVDEIAVGIGGGPSEKSYAWSYGVKPDDRNYARLAPGENAEIRNVSRKTFTEVVNQIADGEFTVSDVLQAKLDAAPPEHRAAVKTEMVKLAKIMQKELKGPNRSNIPGF